MNKIGFDNELYIKLQSEKILERIKMFNDKLISSLAENFLTICTHPECFQGLTRI